MHYIPNIKLIHGKLIFGMASLCITNWGTQTWCSSSFFEWFFSPSMEVVYSYLCIFICNQTFFIGFKSDEFSDHLWKSLTPWKSLTLWKCLIPWCEKWPVLTHFFHSLKLNFFLNDCLFQTNNARDLYMVSSESW